MITYYPWAEYKLDRLEFEKYEQNIIVINEIYGDNVVSFPSMNPMSSEIMGKNVMFIIIEKEKKQLQINFVSQNKESSINYLLCIAHIIGDASINKELIDVDIHNNNKFTGVAKGCELVNMQNNSTALFVILSYKELCDK